jgi:tetratricopeptide (TPR) repeat protein
MNKIKITIGFALIFFANIVFAQNFDAYKFYLKGMLEQRSGKLRQAQKDYQRAIAADGQALGIYQDLAYLYWHLGDKDEAMGIIEKLNDIDGENPKTTAFIGNFYLIANSTENAKIFWDKTLKLDPENETALYALAAQYFNNSDFVQSEKYWKLFLAQEPESIPGHLQLGLVQEKRDENETALKTYDELIKLRPEISEAYIAKARIYENTGRIKLAAEEFEKLLKFYPHNPFILVNLGRYYFLENDLDKAQAALKEAKEIAPNDLNASYWLGAVYEKQGNIDAAIYEFEKITKTEENLFVMAKLGYFYAIKRDFKKSEKYFLKALQKDPNNAELLFFTALSYMDLQKKDKAIEYFTKLVNVKPDFSEGYFFLGQAYERKGDIKNAEISLLKAIELNPGDDKAKNMLAYIYVENNINDQQAKELLEAAAAKDPQNGFVLYSLGRLYFRFALQAPIAQRVILAERAEKILIAGVNITRDPRAYECVGDVYMFLNKYADAWVVYYLAYEITEGKEVKKKIQEAQKNMTDAELFSKMLFIAESQYLKLFSLRAGYKVKASAGLIGDSSFVVLNFVKGEGILLEFPAMLIDMKIYIKDGKVIYVPKIMNWQNDPQTADFAQITSGLMETAAEIFNADFFRRFDNAKTTKKGDDVIYETPLMTLILSAKNSLIKRIIKDDMTIEVVKTAKFFSSQIPSKIKIKSPNWNFSITIESDKFNFATEHINIPKN